MKKQSATQLIGKEQTEELIALRKAIHARPELSGSEEQTASKIVEYLQKCSATKITEQIGGYGVLAEFDSGEEGQSILFRAELDALPIDEVNEFDYRSEYAGISHKCGHDGHMVILLGLASILSTHPPKSGKVYLLFQPAEETGRGAELVLSDPVFNEYNPDYVFALHNLPGYPLRQIIVKEGPFTAAVTSPIIKLTGKTSHAAEPEYGINPAFAIAEIIKEADKLMINEPAREDFSVIVPVHIHLGDKAYGTSPGYGELHFTIRTWKEKQLEKLSKELQYIVKVKAKKYKLNFQMEWTDHFRANENNADAIQQIIASADELGLDYVQKKEPFKWGEDFGSFTQRYRGAMFGIGAGQNQPALHNPDYDFPDELIDTGATMFYNIVKNILN